MQTVKKRPALFFAAALIVVSTSALGQQSTSRPAAPKPPAHPQTVQAAQPAAQSEAPQRTTATYASWIVQCETQAGPPPQKVCDMSQVVEVQNQGRSAPFSRIAVAHPVKGQPAKLTVQVPVSVTIATEMRLQAGDADSGIAAPFARCIPSGCFADFDIKEETLKKFRTSSAGKLSFADGGGHEVAVPLSFNGFSQAYDALAKE